MVVSLRSNAATANAADEDVEVAEVRPDEAGPPEKTHAVGGGLNGGGVKASLPAVASELETSYAAVVAAPGCCALVVDWEAVDGHGVREEKPAPRIVS